MLEESTERWGWEVGRGQVVTKNLVWQLSSLNFTQNVMEKYWAVLSSLFYFRKLILGVIEKLDWRDGGEGGQAEEQRPVRGLLQRVRWDMRSAWTQAVVSACRSEKGFQVWRKQKWRDADYPENMAFSINTLKNWSKCDLSTIKAVHILYLQINTNPIHVFEVDNYHC